MKRRINCIFILIITLLFAACATPVKHNTPSGRPEVTISGKVGKQVQAEIINLMLNNGYNAKSSTDTLLVFERPIENVLAAVLLGSKYDSTPSARVTFNIIEMVDSTRVVASFAAVTNPGSAFERITPLNNNADTTNYQMRLNEIKALVSNYPQPEQGTTDEHRESLKRYELPENKTEVTSSEFQEEKKLREINYADGSKYIGNILDGKRHGQGTYIWFSRDKYVGDFQNNRATGGWFYKTTGRKVWVYQDTEGNWIIKE